ncbi:MAG: acyl--CoA ligase [Deltaproteobacteria bacterium]|jgi:acyl-CoA synthetase (AMP-forming)/AMP-acid ligase II|nr:acyl--CoA ligase [Deltaproteobacteria bacterium]
MSQLEVQEAVRAQLTAAGAPFEMVVEDVLGASMRVFKNRARSLRELLADSVQHGDAEYLIDRDDRISFVEHRRRVAATARVLHEEYGLRKGDRVAIFAENSAEWAIAFWATVSLGGIVAALNGWWTADEFCHAMDLCEPRLLIGDRKRLERVGGIEITPPVVEIEKELPSLRSNRDGAELPDVPIAEDDPAVILFTSGTTGRSKGAVNSHRSLIGFVQSSVYNGAVSALAAARMQEGKSPAPGGSSKQTVLVTSPMFHLSMLYGAVVMQMVLGGRLVIMRGRFDPVAVLEAIERERVTLWPALGRAAPTVAAHPDREKYDLSSVDSIGIGGAPVSPSVQEALRKAFPSAALGLRMGYTSSEAVGIVANIGGSEYQDNPTSTGRIVDGVEVEIRDDAGHAVSEGVEGEIHVRSPYVMLEYWRNPEATDAAIKPGRWLAMGDIGRLDGGRLYINSRARDMILVNAENVYPIEIEYRLDAHPAVLESAVVPVDDSLTGQAVKAVVVVGDESPSAEELEAWCRETLASYKIPTHWDFRRERLPRNPTGKILKNILQGSEASRFEDGTASTLATAREDSR